MFHKLSKKTEKDHEAVIMIKFYFFKLFWIIPVGASAAHQ